MKKILSLAIFLCFYGIAHAKLVDVQTASQVGKHFLLSFTNNSTIQQEANLQLVYTLNEENKTGNPHDSTIPELYIFNLINQKVFVIVSAEDNIVPILGYSFEQSFSPENIPDNVRNWIAHYAKGIKLVRQQSISSTPSIKQQWIDLLSSSNNNQLTKTASLAKASSVAPLLQTTWDQTTFYNDKCPFDYSYNARSLTGCVATAMAQVMKYWNYPAKGEGFHGYFTSKYGYLFANFGTTKLNWSNMTNTLNNSNTDVANLMYECGVGVDMIYGVSATGGSGAYVISATSSFTNCAEYAFKNYFKYYGAKGIARYNYADSTWINLLENEISAGRPIIYDGFNTSYGHCWVADGYDVNNFFHFNFGWSGSCNGYYYMNNINPSIYTFNNSQEAIIGLDSTSPKPYRLALSSPLTLASNNIPYAPGVSATANIFNNGSTTFNGDICAAAFDSVNNFVDYIEVKYGKTLAPQTQFSSNLVFNVGGNYTLLPGKYTIQLYYRTSSSDWTPIMDSANNINSVALTITSLNTIQLITPLVLTPTQFVQGQSASVNVNVKNTGTTSYKGYYQMNLYHLDGSYATTISTLQDKNGLAPNNSYLYPYMNFTTSALNTPPGNYLLALIHQPNGGNWQWTGTGNAQNPVKIYVAPAPCTADIYERNDSMNKAYPLPLNIFADTAEIKTTGSNFHVGTDVDYYKIVLPAGYNYAFNTIVYDAHRNNDTITYSADAKFCFTKDSVNWSSFYHDTMTCTFTAKGGQTVYVFVNQKYAGATGTYLLDIKIKRSPFYVSGNITNPSGIPIPRVTLRSKSNIADTNTLIPTGNFTHYLSGSKDTLTLSKNNDIRKPNGVSTIDIAIIQAHILQKNILNSPYKIIAADVDKNGVVNTIDIVYIKRLILGLDTTFKGNRLWAFIDSSFVFTNPKNPFPYKEYRSYNTLSDNAPNQNFIGVKLGDVNYDWSPSIARTATTTTQPLELYYPNITTTNCPQIILPIRVKNFSDLIGFQFNLHFNPQHLKFKNLQTPSLHIDYSDKAASQGNITFLWNNPNNQPVHLKDGSILLQLEFDKIGNFQEEDISITTDTIDAEAINTQYNKIEIIKTSGKIITQQSTPTILVQNK